MKQLKKILILVQAFIVMVFLTYYTENNVREITDKISETRNKLTRIDEDLRVLEAEWSYLNNPERLTALSEKINDDMKSPTKLQFTDLKNIPIREVMVSNNAQNQANIP
jgi:hypothetical protein